MVIPLHIIYIYNYIIKINYTIRNNILASNSIIFIIILLSCELHQDEIPD